MRSSYHWSLNFPQFGQQMLARILVNEKIFTSTQVIAQFTLFVNQSRIHSKSIYVFLCRQINGQMEVFWKKLKHFSANDSPKHSTTKLDWMTFRLRLLAANHDCYKFIASFEIETFSRAGFVGTHWISIFFFRVFHCVMDFTTNINRRIS